MAIELTRVWLLNLLGSTSNSKELYQDSSGDGDAMQ